ncbi:O-acyltransferase like protein isoform X2 [Ictalurus punctatus]|uniref:O-acyltransferase like protein isoform X2 n=1 Tax=Ictalurus punctatus TaxID=7998 RepID=A0A2D0T312_ICTPU|nr:O-acyltransferase like protein isoform X2 [Ictalurus punctatus]
MVHYSWPENAKMLQVRKITILSTLCFFFCSCAAVCGLNISTKCAQDAAMFLTELKKSQPDQYAVLMYDAFGKMGSDVEGGNVNRVGSLQECLSVEGPGFGGQYCQVFLKQGALDYFVGICVPDSCDEADVSTLIVYGDFLQGQTPFITSVPDLFISESTLGIFMTHCIRNNITPDLSAVVCLCVCIIMVALPLVVTVYVAVVQWNNKKEAQSNVDPANYGAILANSSANQSKECILLQNTQVQECDKEEEHEGRDTGRVMSFLHSLSVRFSGVCFGDGVCDSVCSRSSYPCLNGVRIFSLFWIICGHTVQLSAWSGLDNRKRWRVAVESNPLYVVAFSGPVYLAVDTFLLIGGLLSAKSFLGCIQRSKDKPNLRLIAHFLFRRFRRIQPLHLFIVCAIVTLFSFLHNGPFWFTAEDQILNCKAFWWSNLLLINNLFTITHTCAPWTWYLSVDFQFYAATPFLICLYTLNKRVFVSVAFTLLAMSCISSALITAFLHLPVHQPTTLEYESYFEYYYNKPYTRYGPYLLGVLTGIYMVTKKEALIKQRWQAAAGWLVSLSVMAVIVGSAYMLRGQGSPGHAVYQGLHRSLWALTVAWLILACEEGYGGFVNRFLSMRVWVPLSNISFACYLVHPLLILLYNSKQETLIHYTDLNFLRRRRKPQRSVKSSVLKMSENLTALTLTVSKC